MRAGNVPLNYQPDLLDPLGRTIMISFRKLFLPSPQRRSAGSSSSDAAAAAALDADALIPHSANIVL